MFACKPHWYALPREYRDQIWRTYRHAPGSEDHTTALGDALRWYRDQLAAEASG